MKSRKGPKTGIKANNKSSGDSEAASMARRRQEISITKPLEGRREEPAPKALTATNTTKNAKKNYSKPNEKQKNSACDFKGQRNGNGEAMSLCQ